MGFGIWNTTGERFALEEGNQWWIGSLEPRAEESMVCRGTVTDAVLELGRVFAVMGPQLHFGEKESNFR
jgi:hypothetical protein